MDHRSACELILLDGNERIRPEHFDPAVLAAFRELAPRFAETFARLQEPVQRTEGRMSRQNPALPLPSSSPTSASSRR